MMAAVLAKGKTTTNVNSFKSDLLASLGKLDIDTTKVNISSISTYYSGISAYYSKLNAEITAAPRCFRVFIY